MTKPYDIVKASISATNSIATTVGGIRHAWQHKRVADVVTAALEEAIEAGRASIIANPLRHVSWGAGDPDCPPELKTANGELHTLRCKVCGSEDFRTICTGGNHEPHHSEMCILRSGGGRLSFCPTGLGGYDKDQSLTRHG